MWWSTDGDGLPEECLLIITIIVIVFVVVVTATIKTGCLQIAIVGAEVNKKQTSKPNNNSSSQRVRPRVPRKPQRNDLLTDASATSAPSNESQV